jgi:hypothetical protein
VSNIATSIPVDGNVTDVKLSKTSLEVPAKGKVQFEVTYTPTQAGPFNFDLVLKNTDENEHTYTIKVSGTGTGATGNVTIAVVSDVSDGTFTFSSPEPEFKTLSVTTVDGKGESSILGIDSGTYHVTAVLPDGFGLTSGSCSDKNDPDGRSTVDVGKKRATINLASGESVICTFNTVDSRTKTTQTIQRFLFRRADLLLNHDPDGERQINRLVNRGGNGSNGGGLKFSGSTGGNRLPATTAFKNDASGLAGGVPSAIATGSSGGLWSFDAPSALGAQDRQGGNPGGAMTTLPFGFSLDGDRARSFSFATSFVRMAKAAAENKQRKLGGGPEQLAALGINAGHLISPEQSDFDIWAEGHFTYFEDGTTGSETNGHFGVLYLGVDYILTPNLLVGALVQIDSMEQTSSELSTKVDGVGWMAGPYMTARLSDNVFFQGRAAWGRSRNDISPFQTYTDAFDTQRWLATGTLKGRWQHGAWLISPSASVGYVEERQESYTDSLDVFIPGQTVSIGQAKFGPEISYRGAFVNGMAIEPFASLEGIWTFSEDGIDDLVVDTLAGNNELRGKVGAGVKALTAGGTALSISGSYDGLGDDDFQAISGELRLAIPLQ